MSEFASKFEKNRILWNKKTSIHIDSDFYDNENFKKGATSLKSIELDILGNLSGKKVLHLQCHFGQDTISLSRLGAKSTGVDLSDSAIEYANKLAIETNQKVDFICCNIYDLKDHLNETFDIIYTSYGTIGWLPDLDKWSNIISHFLKPRGKFIFVEFHPVVWMFDDDFSHVKYNYFNNGVIEESEEGSYTDRDADLTGEYACWNHGISEVVNSLINNNIKIQSLKEYNFSPYNCFNKTIEFKPGNFRIEHMGNKIPMVYSIEGIKL